MEVTFGTIFSHNPKDLIQNKDGKPKETCKRLLF